MAAALWPGNERKGSFWGVVDVWWESTTAKIEHKCSISGGHCWRARENPLPPKSTANGFLGLWGWCVVVASRSPQPLKSSAISRVVGLLISGGDGFSVVEELVYKINDEPQLTSKTIQHIFDNARVLTM